MYQPFVNAAYMGALGAAREGGAYATAEAFRYAHRASKHTVNKLTNHVKETISKKHPDAKRHGVQKLDCY